MAAATQAIADPIHDEGASISEEALEEIVRVTEGYPYFLQEWGKHTWQQPKQHEPPSTAIFSVCGLTA